MYFSIDSGKIIGTFEKDGDGGLALRTHIRRRNLYQQIKADALKIGKQAVPCSFRHISAKESHASGF